ncbi:4-hydroxy-3-methylbut-2-enyl diphosphate reductase [Candidatus Riesia pediculicola]|uniref:4-hydroxy-3-methylbut-2-enyl diphosphate reductase n=1 Tax=Candidatus Riesia pediculicola TaxID=401619 RepID=UPI0009C2C006|nr:4-hydroxy-3-methylbut-2-enyl diphosphate reductase [Candidatus Riesia pediculicola]ARC54421.1 hypothetical protein AOE57_02470 [Candidatus Riesia pediculicola]
MKIFLANPRGFCAGVRRSIDCVNFAMNFHKPVYVKHEIVHNNHVVEGFRKKGINFIEKISDVPDGSILIFSAHGVSRSIFLEAKKRNSLSILDATCPLVKKIHTRIHRASKNSQDVILIGDPKHPEIQGSVGHYERNERSKIYVVNSLHDIDHINLRNTEDLIFSTQTTLSIDHTKLMIKKLISKFPKVKGPSSSEICYATRNRQEALRELSKKSNTILVVGSKNSSNSNSLLKLSKKLGKEGYLIDTIKEIEKISFNRSLPIGLTAGASTPSSMIFEVIKRLNRIGFDEIQEISPFRKEKMIFRLPRFEH